MDQERNSKYLNRELSWLEFNDRVLDEARSIKNDIIDRIKFLTISASNLDEFDMVRLASLDTMYKKGNTDIDISGRTYKEQYEEVSEETAAFNKRQYDVLEDILDDLKKEGFSFVTEYSSLDEEQKAFLTEYYQKKILPLIEIIEVPENDARSVEFYNSIENKSLNVCMVDKKDDGSFNSYNIAISKNLDRFVEIPTKDDGHLYTFCENIIEYNLSKERPYAYTAPYRVTRNATFVAESRDITRLMDELEEKLNERRHGNVIKLEIANNAYPFIQEKLRKGFQVEDDLQVYNPSRPIDLTVWKDATKIPEIKKTYKKAEEYVPRVPKKFRKVGGSGDIFKTIDKKDALLFHPYDSFKPVLDFIEASATDKNVKSIKQTLYRVSKDSPIVKSLRKAAKNGKEVTVLVELKARFNEEDNIAWAKKLEEAGCKVLYGLPGLKVHSKITTVERVEKGEIKHYTHLSTGNYNEVTANIYTDLGLLTSNEEIGLDAQAFFEHLENPTVFPQYRKLTVAPEGIKPRLLQMINNEIENVNAGKEGFIKMKMNSLCDEEIINALYDASNAGVKVELLVRGICCIRPTENLTVRSVVGKYLEHSRIYEFANGGDTKVFLSSADCMPRNLNRRVEILFPVEEEKIKEKVKLIFETGFNDIMSYELNSSGSYKKVCQIEAELESKDRDILNKYRTHDSQKCFEELTLKEIKGYVEDAEENFSSLEEDFSIEI